MSSTPEACTEAPPAATVTDEQQPTKEATEGAVSGTVEEPTATNPDGTTTTYEYGPLDDLDLPPLRIHATRVRDRLSASNLQIPPGIQSQMTQKRYSLDSKVAHISNSPTGVGSASSSIASRHRGRSRSRSPSLRGGKADRATITTADGNSSLSSLEEFVDPDILYDKMGFVELDKNKSHQHHNSYTFGDNNNTRTINLTPVSERMSEDTLEDVHAFSDLSANTNTRPSSSVGTGGSTVGGEVSSHVLEPLDEGDEDLESEDDVEEGEAQGAQVILTNLENLALQDDNKKIPAAASS